MKEINVNGQKRTDTGKKASKLLRKEGMVPCNLYGEKKDENGLPEALSFAASVAELRKAVYTPHVYVVNLNIDLNVHGVGGVDTWGQRTLPQYTIDGNQPYTKKTSNIDS